MKDIVLCEHKIKTNKRLNKNRINQGSMNYLFIKQLILSRRVSCYKIKLAFVRQSNYCTRASQKISVQQLLCYFSTTEQSQRHEQENRVDVLMLCHVCPSIHQPKRNELCRYAKDMSVYSPVACYWKNYIQNLLSQFKGLHHHVCHVYKTILTKSTCIICLSFIIFNYYKDFIIIR